MTSALIIFYVFIALALIALVLLQDPKGGGGAIFGGGGGKSLFGATGATSFIVKATRLVAVLFALCVIGINYTLMNGNGSSAVDSDVEITAPVLESVKATAPVKDSKEAPTKLDDAKNKVEDSVKKEEEK